MTLSEMRRLLSERGVRLTRSLGQTFLHDGNQLRRIVRLAGVSRQDRLVEIGPGLGPLTELLSEAGGEVLAIEKDRCLFEYLRERFAGCAGLTLMEADALDYVRQSKPDWTGWKLVSNLPYSVGSAVLVELAQQSAGPACIVVTLQLEVVQRLLAEPGTKSYGVLTLLVGANYQPGNWFRIPASCFYPAPAVDSACLRLDRRGSSLVPAEAVSAYVRVVKLAFSQRRKMMFKLLKAEWGTSALQAAFARTGLGLHVRAEELSLPRFADLARMLGRPSGSKE